MFILKSIEQLEKAIKKAKAVRTQVKYIKFGEYQVKGSKGNFYTVKCQKIGNEKQVSCECFGGQKGLVCFHSASVLGLHTFLARQRQTA